MHALEDDQPYSGCAMLLCWMWKVKTGHMWQPLVWQGYISAVTECFSSQRVRSEGVICSPDSYLRSVPSSTSPLSQGWIESGMNPCLQTTCMLLFPPFRFPACWFERWARLMEATNTLTFPPMLLKQKQLGQRKENK